MAAVPVFVALYHQYFHQLRHMGVRQLQDEEEEISEESTTLEEDNSDVDMTTLIVASI